MRFRRLVFLLPLAAVLAAAASPASAKAFRVYRSSGGMYSGTSPQVVYDARLDAFLILGHERRAVKTRLVGHEAHDREVWMLRAFNHGERYEPRLALSEDTGTYLLADNSQRYLRLDASGRRIASHEFPRTFSLHGLDLTAIAGTGDWFAVLEECKYGCRHYGWIVGPEGELRHYLDLAELPFDDMYFSVDRRWQAGFDADKGTLLVVWEDAYDDTPAGEGPSRAVMGQRLRPDGRFVGERLEIARHRKNASQPRLVYNPRRREALIVYREGNRVKGRFLIGGRLSAPIRFDERGDRGEVPSAAYSAERDVYLVTWVASRRGGGLWGRWVSGDGRPLESPFLIRDGGRDTTLWMPGYAACGDDECLVAWLDGTGPGATRARFLGIP